MARETAQFPAAVWDRSSKTRGTDVYVNREPTYEDWDQIIAEVQAVETYLSGSVYGFSVKPLAFGGGDTWGAILLTFTFTIPNTAGNYDIVLADKVRVLDAFLVKNNGQGADGDNVTVKNGTHNISDALNMISVDLKSVVRAHEIDPSFAVVSAGGTLRVSAAKADDCSCYVVVTAMRVP